MFENIAAIAVENSGVRMIKARTGISGFTVKSLSFEDFDPSCTSKEEAVVRALKKMTAEDPVEGFRIITDFPMDRSLIRTICFPFSEPQKIKEAIPFEAEENVPFPVDELYMDFENLGSSETSGRILLAAAKKENVRSYLKQFTDAGLQPCFVGLEADSLASCYSHLCTVKDETVLQLHIDEQRAVISILENDRLIFTRTCKSPTAAVLQKISDVMKTGPAESAALLNRMNNAGIFGEHPAADKLKEAGLTKVQAGRISEVRNSEIREFLEQIKLTVRACTNETEIRSFNRIIVSGSQADNGPAAAAGREMDLPVVSMPFIPEYTDEKINILFHKTLGILASYVNRKQGSINYIKDEFVPDINSSRKIYLLAGFFVCLTVLILFVNTFLAGIFGSASADKYEKLMGDAYTKYFGEKTVPDNPLSAAKEKLRKAKKEQDSINSVIGTRNSALKQIKELAQFFEKDPSFELKTLVLSDSSIRMEGSSASGTGIDVFKEKLQQTGKYDSVSLNISSSKKGNSAFTLTIKMKKEKAGRK